MTSFEPGLFNEHDNALGVIGIELSRLMGVIMAATWTIIRPAPGRHFIANDRGWLLIGHEGRATPGFFVPLAPDALLHVRPAWQREILRAEGLRWMAAGLTEMGFDAEQTDFANRCIALAALNEIYGPDAPTLEAYRSTLSEPPWLSDINHMGFPWGRVSSPTQLDWMRAACLCMSMPGSPIFLPPDLPPNTAFEKLPFRPPIPTFVDAPNYVSGLEVKQQYISLELFPEPFLCAPVPMDNTARLLEAPLLQTLYRQHGRFLYGKAEEDFRLVLSMRSGSPVNELDHRYDFPPCSSVTARDHLDRDYLARKKAKESSATWTHDKAPSPLMFADLELRTKSG